MGGDRTTDALANSLLDLNIHSQDQGNILSEPLVRRQDFTEE
jgi:hypothetical protein